MVKVGSGIGIKKGMGAPREGGNGYDSIPLMGPLQSGSTQHRPPDQVIVTTSSAHQQQKRKRRSFLPDMRRLRGTFPTGLSERAKFTGLFVAMVLLATLLLLVMYKSLWLDHMSCPQGFIFKSKHCTPEARLMHSGHQGAMAAVGQQQQQASFYSALQSKRPMPELLPSSWLPIVNALKDAQLANEEAEHAHQ
ncbi:neuronal vesicle trafficking-associated protein 1-like [Engraulis encrasicolus]|uniref:neuronal vesicle trafficking-associated protein 1-like n=1 Tax=Engraulis encrasicolus TaxID=184585 RepID=UPI002FD46AFA